VTSETYLPDKKLPCPIIFIHGLNDKDVTWYPFAIDLSYKFGLTNGGNFDFCLNPDRDLTRADSRTLIQTSGQFQSRVISSGDFYFVNFDVTSYGVLYPDPKTSPDLSNQSAIHKQGFALQSVIKKVRELTGAAEVILMGHSMGGLAARQYIQDSTNWQSDGKHHVAKLVTVATPHGGSNLAGGLISKWKNGTDEKSEAVRDLRHPSFSSRFLFGGLESGITESYYNKDVNCNGTSNDNIKGLNSKSFSSDIPVACVIGTGIQSLCAGTASSDWVVCDDRADFNQYSTPIPTPYADKFSIESNQPYINFLNDRAYHSNLHTNLLNYPTLVQALDEPKTYDKAYDIPIGLGFFGNVTMQATNDPFPEPIKSTDYDDYRFTIPVKSNVQIIVANIPVHNFNAYIVNANEQVLFTFPSNKGSNISTIVTLEAGTYFLETEATPDINSWQYPYLFGVLATPVAGPVAAFGASIRQGCSPLAITFSSQSTGSPTAFEWTFEGGNPATSTLSNPTVSYVSSGSYNVTLTARNSNGSNTLTRRSFVSVGRIPVAAFSYSNATTSDLLTVSFYNTSSIGVDAQYLWNFGDGTTSTEASPQHTYTRYGTFNVTLTVSNACGTASSPKTITFTTPTTEIEKSKINFDIAPNPNDGNFTITIKQTDIDLGKCQLTIFNTLGQTLYLSTIDASSSVSLPLSLNIPNGSYIAVLNSEKGKTYRKFIVQR
jgi:PKD repeat protein/pimeloyl-ACP methyl ester carboxylesterase